MSAVVEVNECKVFATAQGAAWWATFRHRYDPIGRITDVKVSIGGNLCYVACDDREHADWLIATMVERGVPASALKARGGERRG